MTLDHLAQVALAASQESEGDWFSPDLLDSDEPIISTRKARAYIAAFTPDVALALVEVCRAAKAYITEYDESGGRPFTEHLGRVREALAALEAKEQP